MNIAEAEQLIGDMQALAEEGACACERKRQPARPQRPVGPRRTSVEDDLLLSGCITIRSRQSLCCGLCGLIHKFQVQRTVEK